MNIYQPWVQSYSNEDFDRIHHLAVELTEIDRKAGRKAPKYGCGEEQYNKAKDIVNRANRYSAQYSGPVEY